MHEPCTYPPLCYNMNPITSYLNQGWVQEQLGVSKTWASCSGAVYPPLEGDWSHSFRQDIVKVLERGHTATVYEGVLDLMCGFTGATAYLESMPWSGQHEFVNSKNTTWSAAGKVAGTFRRAHGLTYMNVYDAGHMVPHGEYPTPFDFPPSSLLCANIAPNHRPTRCRARNPYERDHQQAPDHVLSIGEDCVSNVGV
jgi:cathepsin A (carboxypeptidase C)